MLDRWGPEESGGSWLGGMDPHPQEGRGPSTQLVLPTTQSYSPT